MSCNFLGHWMGFVVDVLTTRQVLCLYIGWYLPMVVSAYGRCYCHSFLWQMLLPLLYISIGRCYCHILLADVIAMICILLDWWQMLLPLWLLLLPLVGMMYHSMADVIAIFWANVNALFVCCCICGRCYCHMADGIAICENFVIGRCCLPRWQME